MIRKMNDKDRKRLKRKIHIRKSIFGTAERPRRTIMRSTKALEMQGVDDDKGHALASAST
jgi:large subunit ribosomal protein L18